MMAGRLVQGGDACDFSQLRLAASVSDNIQNQEGTIERLNTTIVAPHWRTGRHHAVRFAPSFDFHRRSPTMFFWIERYPAWRVKRIFTWLSAFLLGEI